MKIVIYPPPGILGLGRSRTVNVITRPLDPAVAAEVAAQLSRDGLPVLPAVDEHEVVHVWGLRSTTTAEEVTALRAFTAVTDAPIRWHPAATA